MTIILGYINCERFITECFFEVVDVDDTKTLTLKKEMCNVLAWYNLLVENLRGQRYNGVSWGVLIHLLVSLISTSVSSLTLQSTHILVHCCIF